MGETGKDHYLLNPEERKERFYMRQEKGEGGGNSFFRSRRTPSRGGGR